MKRQILILLAFSFSVVAQSQFLKDKDSIENFEGYFDFHYDQKKMRSIWKWKTWIQSFYILTF